MLKKLLVLYKNSILYKEKPEKPAQNYIYFFDNQETEWIGIPKSELNEDELKLMKTLYELVNFQAPVISREAAGWHSFLLEKGNLPAASSNGTYRFIQFSITDDQIDQLEFESALKGFFTEDAVIIWENNSYGAVVEEKKNVILSEKELISLSEILESDFYIKASFYIGKFHPFSDQLPSFYQRDKQYFTFGLNHLKNVSLLTFERVFPAYTVSKLPAEVIDKVYNEIAGIFNEDPELLVTIRVFLENNMNASVTAKKLYIHRNTLQYRIDKFVEKTDIGLKDFYGAFTVFLACLLYELESFHNNMPN